MSSPRPIVAGEWRGCPRSNRASVDTVSDTRAATRRWLTGEATREATHELIASAPEQVLRTFGALAAPDGRTSSPG